MSLTYSRSILDSHQTYQYIKLWWKLRSIHKEEDENFNSGSTENFSI